MKLNYSDEHLTLDLKTEKDAKPDFVPYRDAQGFTGRIPVQLSLKGALPAHLLTLDTFGRLLSRALDPNDPMAPEQDPDLSADDHEDVFNAYSAAIIQVTAHCLNAEAARHMGTPTDKILRALLDNIRIETQALEMQLKMAELDSRTFSGQPLKTPNPETNGHHVEIAYDLNDPAP